MFYMHGRHNWDPMEQGSARQNGGASHLEGFTPEVVRRLQAARDRYMAGKLNEGTADDKRLSFARWLYQHGKIAA